MVNRLSHVIFILVFTAIFIIDGWGLPYGRNISLSILLYIPSILMLIHTFAKRKIYIPKIAIWFTLFLLLNTFATFFSTDVDRSRNYQSYYFSIFIIYIYVFNNSTAFRSYFHKLLLLLGILTIGYALVFRFYLSTRFPFLIPDHGYQLIHPYVGFLTHHPIGIVGLILISIIIIDLFYKLTAARIFTVIIFFITLLVSYMRAGYVALFGSILLLVYKHRKIPIKIFLMFFGVMCIIFLAFIMVTSLKDSYPPIKNIKFLNVEYVNLYSKTLFNARDKYAYQSFRAIAEKPVLGFGPNNFITASRKYAQDGAVFTETSTNILLDFMVENGVVAGISITYFFILIAINAYKSTSLDDVTGMKLFMIYVSLLILFQFGYYYGSHAVFLTFMIIAALLSQQKNYIVDKYRLTLIASILLPFIHMFYRISF